MAEQNNIWDRHGDKLPEIFRRTIYRVPTEEELEEVNGFELTADDLKQGFGYTIVGRGISTSKTKAMIIESIDKLSRMFPENEEYKKALKKSAEIEVRFTESTARDATMSYPNQAHDASGGIDVAGGTSNPYEPALDTVASHFDRTEEDPEKPLRKKKKRMKKFKEFSREDMVYNGDDRAVTSYPTNESGVHLDEGVSAGRFTEGLVSHMQKYLPKDRWTVSLEHGEIVIKNDFDETATYRIQEYESNEGKFRQPNIPARGSADE